MGADRRTHMVYGSTYAYSVKCSVVQHLVQDARVVFQSLARFAASILPC